MILFSLLHLLILMMGSISDSNQNKTLVYDGILRNLLWKKGAGHEKAASVAVDKIRGSTPFILLFTSGSGSTWMWQKLSVTPGVCMLGFEPLADCSNEKSNLEKKLSWIRVALSTPGGLTDEEKRAKWHSWSHKLVEKSLPCRVKEVAHSFEGNRCHPVRTFAVGFRLRVTKPLGRSEKWPLMKATLFELTTRIVWLRRRNLLQQALSEYNTLLRTFGKTSVGAKNQLDGRAPVHLDQFTSVLENLQLRNREAHRMVRALGVPHLEIFYEELMLSHGWDRQLEPFLNIGPDVVKLEESPYSVYIPPHLQLNKRTPHDLCGAVANYEVFCRKFSNKRYSPYLSNPCVATATKGRCCRCDFTHEDDSLEVHLDELAKQQDALPRFTDPKPRVYADPKGKRLWALKQEMKDDDDMAVLAPGRREHVTLHNGMANIQMTMPEWFETAVQ